MPLKRQPERHLFMDFCSSSSDAKDVYGEQRYVDAMAKQQDYHDRDPETHPNLFRHVRDGTVEKVKEYIEHIGRGDFECNGSQRDGQKRSRGHNWECESQIKKRRRDLLQDRGEVGEIPLHMACLYNRPDIAIELIHQHLQLDIPVHLPFHKDGPTVSHFEGENCLHIAVAQSADQIVNELLSDKIPRDEREKLLSGRAIGEFFGPPKNWKDMPTINDGWHYYGETPLAFAVSMGRVDMCDKLLGDSGGNECTLLRHQDQYGNNLVHMCVIHDQRKMLDHLFRWHEHEAKHCFQQRNKEIHSDSRSGLTPLMKAVRLGNAEIVAWIEERQRTVLWKFGDTVCEQVPLDEIDPVLRKDSTSNFEHEHEFSVLNEIDKCGHKELLHDGSLAWRLVEYKWSKFAATIFHRRLKRTLLALLALLLSLCLDDLERSAPRNIVFTLCACVMDLGGNSIDSVVLLSFNNILLAASQAVVLLVSSFKLWIELDEWWSCGTQMYWNISGARFIENFISVAASVFIIGSEIVHAAIEVELSREASSLLWIVQALKAIGAVTAWFYLFFFLLGYKQTGKFVVMMWDMLLFDIIQYVIVFLTFVIAFSQGFYSLLRRDQRFGIDGLLSLLHDLAHAMMGDTDDLEKMARAEADEGDSGKTGPVAPLIFAILVVVYIILATLMMFNTLVAAMNDTYNTHTDEAELTWKLERTRIIASLESEMNASGLRQDEYWVKRDGQRVLIETRRLDPDAHASFACTCKRCRPDQVE